MARNAVELWFTVELSQRNASQLTIENYKVPSQHGFAPHQTLIPVSNEKHVDYAWEVAKKLRDRGVRADVDERNEKCKFKIRASQTGKIPYQCWLLETRKWKTELLTRSSLWPRNTNYAQLLTLLKLSLTDIDNKSRIEIRDKTLDKI